MSSVRVAMLTVFATAFFLTHYNDVLRSGSIPDQICVWTTDPTKYVFVTQAIFDVNDKKGTHPSYYVGSLPFDTVSDTLLSRVFDEILGVLAKFGFLSLS